jgi:hypothetical protein
MAIRILKEVSRDGGRLPATGASVIAGMVLELATGAVQPYVGAGLVEPWGLASDSNVTQPLQGAGGLTVGVGYDYTNFNRGGLIGAFQNGGVFELYNDGTGNPFVTAPVLAYAENEPLYSTAAGLITTAATIAQSKLGTCVSVANAGSATAMRLQLKLSI